MGIPEMTEQRNRIMIFGPKSDGTYVIEFRMAAGEALAISIPRNEAWRDPAFSGANAVWAVCPGRVLGGLVVALLNVSFDAVSEAHLRDLVSTGVPEGVFLEYRPMATVMRTLKSI